MPCAGGGLHGSASSRWFGERMERGGSSTRPPYRPCVCARWKGEGRGSVGDTLTAPATRPVSGPMTSHSNDDSIPTL